MEDTRKRKLDDDDADETGDQKRRFDGRVVIERARNQEGIRSKLVLMYSLNDDAFTIIDSAVNHARLTLSVKNLGPKVQ